MFSASGPLPDALFVANDYMAMTALSVLRHEFKLRVPQDVAVIGFDDIPVVASPEYSLTTVRQPMDSMVENSVRLLMADMARDDPEPEHLTLAARLVVRGTTL
jgi:LacI family transcriptional regulator